MQGKRDSGLFHTSGHRDTNVVSNRCGCTRGRGEETDRDVDVLRRTDRQRGIGLQLLVGADRSRGDNAHRQPPASASRILSIDEHRHAEVLDRV